MPDEKVQAGKNEAATAEKTASISVPQRVLGWSVQSWRPAATMVAVVLALLLGWHVVNGKNGLSVWHEKRVEDRQLRKEIDGLEQENAHLRNRVERLKSNPDAIGMVAREKLHYAKPNEVIVTLPPDSQTQTQQAGTGK
jgi:cell division protein FtsB